MLRKFMKLYIHENEHNLQNRIELSYSRYAKKNVNY